MHDKDPAQRSPSGDYIDDFGRVLLSSNQGSEVNHLALTLGMTDRQAARTSYKADGFLAVVEQAYRCFDATMSLQGAELEQWQEEARTAVSYNYTKNIRLKDLHFIAEEKALFGLFAEEEVEYFKDVTHKADEIDEDVSFAATGKYTPPAVRQTTGLEDNTSENLEKLLGAVDAYTAATALENYGRMAGLASFIALHGNEEEIRDTASIFEIERGVVNDPRLRNYLENLLAQRLVNSQLLDVGQQLLDRGGLKTNEQAEQLELLLHHGKNINSYYINQAYTAYNILYSREFRLNGNEFPDPEQALILRPSSLVKLARDVDFQFVSEESQDMVADSVADNEQRQIRQQYAAKVKEYLGGVTVSQPATLSSNEIRRRHLDEARAALVKGEQDEDGNDVIIGRSKHEAREYISDIEALRWMLTSTSTLLAAKDRLNAMISSFNELKSRIDTLINEPGGGPSETLGIQLEDRESPEVFVERVKADWTTVEAVVKNHWPNGPETAEQLRQLLFMSREEIEVSLEGAVSGEAIQEELIELEPDSEIDIKPLESQSALAEIAERLDTVILPPRATKEDVMRVVQESELSEAQTAQIDWERLFTLVQLREHNGGVLYRSKAGDLGNAPPYFVVALQANGDTYAVAESPVEGNATYVVSEKLCPGTWLEVLALSKEDARAVGARRVIHRGEKGGDYHREKVQNVLFDLMAVKAA